MTEIRCIDGIYYELRPLPPLAPNEWRDEKGEVLRFEWQYRENGHPMALALNKAGRCGSAWVCELQYEKDDPIRKALIAWASRPENLPHDVAIKDGIPYLMKDDEARGPSGVPRHCGYWDGEDIQIIPFHPGQRERIEKCRASQVPKLADDEVFEKVLRKIHDVTINPFTREVLVFAKGFGYHIATETGLLRGQSLTNARDYAKKHLKLAPDEYLCEESWTVKKRERWSRAFVSHCWHEERGKFVRCRVTETEIFPGEE